MFVEVNEMESKIYKYQLDQITQENEALIIVAIEAAIEETSSYLSERYDTKKIFEAQGKDRNAHLLNVVKTLALWQIIQLSSVDILYNRVQEEYDRSINWLNRVSLGRVSPHLPTLDAEQTEGFYLECNSQQNNDY